MSNLLVNESKVQEAGGAELVLVKALALLVTESAVCMSGLLVNESKVREAGGVELVLVDHW